MEKIKYAGIAIQKPEYKQPQLTCFHSYDPNINNLISLVVAQVDIYVNHKKSYEPSNLTKGYSIQYTVVDEVIYISSAYTDFPQRICFRFLDKLREEFELKDKNFVTDKDKLTFEQHIKRLMDFYSNDDSSDPLREVNAKIDQVSGIMTDNIKAVLKKGENLEGLLTEVNRLEANADEFQVRARKVKCTLCLQNLKWCIITALVVIACLLLILAVAAGVVYYFFFM